MQTDWVSIAQPLALELLGEPSKKSSNEWRWGRKGSLVLNLESASWYDHEADQGGGLIDLIKRQGLNPDEILQKYHNKPVQTFKKSYTDQDMYNLKHDSEIYVRYSASFCVMRFNDQHSIKQKYAPFTKEGDLWYMRRPKEQLPIYLEERKKDSYVVISEGEKAMIGSKEIYDGDVCCHHGGVGNWDNCDWSILKQRRIIIWPDNDEPGKKFAKELAEHLTPFVESVTIVKPPSTFNDKDDLYDAHKNNYFSSSEHFLNYCLSNLIKKPTSFELVPVSQIIRDIKKPDWLIEDIAEKDSVIAIFGAPKAGKSFITVDIASHIAKGLDWHGFKTEQSSVVYLAGEGQRGIARRINAWSQLNNENLDTAPLLVSNRGARLLDDKDHDMLKQTIESTEDHYGKVGLIIIDTLARNFGAGNENSTEDMNSFIEKIDDLKNHFGACIMLVHHTGHNANTRARGSSVLPAAVDWEYKVTREDIGDEMWIEFSQTLVKDGNPIQPLDFKFDVQELPFEGVTSGALSKRDKQDKPKPASMNDDDNTIYSYILNEQKSNENPGSVFVKHTEVINGTGLTKNKVNKSLKKLTEVLNKLVKGEQGGYQTNEFKDEIF